MLSKKILVLTIKFIFYIIWINKKQRKSEKMEKIEDESLGAVHTHTHRGFNK